MIAETEVNTDYTADEVRKAFKAIPKFGGWADPACVETSSERRGVQIQV